MTLAARALQNQNLSGEGINLWLKYIFFVHTRTWRAFSDEGSAQCRGLLRDKTKITDDTHQAHSQSFQQGEYEMMIMAARWC